MIPQLSLVTASISLFDLPIERLSHLLSDPHLLGVGVGVGLLVILGVMWVLAGRAYLLRRLMNFSGGRSPGVKRNE